MFLLVLLLHLLAGHWIGRQQRLLGQTANPKPPLEVLLLKPQAIQRVAPHSTATSPILPAKPAEIRHATQAAKTEAPVLKSLDTSAAHAPDAASATASAASAPAGAAPGAGTASAAVAATAHRGARFSLPPAADLRYDTFVNGQQNMPGTISWITDGQHYDLVVAVPIPFVGKYTYLSHGQVDAFGLAPERYTEQRGSRGHDETHFERSAKRISFSRTPATLALPDGAQDRFSMVFQLASLVRGDPARYTPGVTRSFYVVDTDSGEDWPVETVGLESVRSGESFIPALHFVRLPRHAGDNRKIDVWLAPSLGYFPVRLVQTEPNGTQIELLLHDAPHRLEALSASAADPAAELAAPASAAASAASAPSAAPIETAVPGAASDAAP